MLRIIANAGHFDVEIDLVTLDKLAAERRVLRDNLGLTPHARRGDEPPA